MAETRTFPCPRCDGPTIEIGMLGGANRLVMRSCSRCDHRSWLRGGEPAVLGDVLASVATTGRRRTA